MTTLQPVIASLPAPSLAQFLTGGGGFFAGMFIFGFIILALLAIAGIASVVGLIYIWVRALKQPTAAEGLAKCARCGYGVRGAATMACPECGADFREVGIISPTMRKTFVGPALFITLWSLCLWIPGCVVSSVVIAVGPQNQVYYEDIDIDPPNTAAAGYNNIMLNRMPYGINSAMFAGELYVGQDDYSDVSIDGPNNYEYYEVDLNNNTFDNYSGMTTAPQPFTRASLETWVANAGGDLKNADVQKQIDQVYNNIQQAKAVTLPSASWSEFKVNSKNTYSEDMPAGWFVLLQPVFWVVIYVVGIVLYFFLKNRYDKAMVTLRDQALANDPYASPPLKAPF